MLLPAIQAHTHAHLVAVADLDGPARDAIAAKDGVHSCAGLDELLALPDVDAVYIATPTHLHRDHVLAAIAAGKHVLVEKPMAPTIAEGDAMTRAAEAAGVTLLVGHSHGYDLPIQAMRELIASGELGRPRIINSSYYSDWFYRPRLPAELDTAQGGGVTFRQGSHQLDIIRVLGGGLLKSIRASTFDWDPQRPGIGAYVAYCSFADGAVATALYNGYGLFQSFEMLDGIGEQGHLEPPERIGSARATFYGNASTDESDAKRQRIARHTFDSGPPHNDFFGSTIVSCERGDIRQSPDGLYVYTIAGRREQRLPVEGVPRQLVIEEFCDAISGRRPALHTGRWGVANIEACLAIVESAAGGTEVVLQHQVASPVGPATVPV
jgi:phthalate 4,5-cis-dihydrodiol dehydrogenase